MGEAGPGCLTEILNPDVTNGGALPGDAGKAGLSLLQNQVA